MNKLLKIVSGIAIGVIVLGLTVFVFWGFLVIALAGAIVGGVYYAYHRFWPGKKSYMKPHVRNTVNQTMIYDVYEEEQKNKNQG